MRSTFFRALGPLALLIAQGWLCAAVAQSDPPANPPPVISAPADAPEPSAPALPKLPTPGETLGAIGRFIDQSVSTVGAGIDAGVKGAGDTIEAGVKGAGETIGGATNAAGGVAKGVTEAAGSVATLPLGNVVTGKQPCPLAPNQAPDCTIASVLLCRSKGFERGTAIDITTSRKCPAQVWLGGGNEAACTNEAFVARASCQ